LEGSAVGLRLLEWGEERSRQALERVPDGLQVVMQTTAYKQHEPSHRRLREYGMTQVRHYWTMMIDLDGPPPPAEWPEGISLRTLRDDADLEAVIRTVQEAFQDHWGYVHSSVEEEMETWRHIIKNDQRFDSSLWWMAIDGDEVAGISLCWPSRNGDESVGWVGTLGVRRPWRKRGLGLALLRHSFGEFYRRGKARVGLGVDSTNLTGATRLYEKAGMRVIEQSDLYQKVLRNGQDLSAQGPEGDVSPLP
jgi:ribosomal protein S18 acetylase RimI-like enzyme